jgi:hypothetical protein
MVAAGRVGYKTRRRRRRFFGASVSVVSLLLCLPVFDRRKASTKELGFPPIVRILRAQAVLQLRLWVHSCDNFVSNVVDTKKWYDPRDDAVVKERRGVVRRSGLHGQTVKIGTG